MTGTDQTHDTIAHAKLYGTINDSPQDVMSLTQEVTSPPHAVTSSRSSIASECSVDSEMSDPDLRCGYGKCKPPCLQRCNNATCLLVVVCWFTFVQSFVVTGIVNVNTATLERRFDLSSSQVAWISSSYDVCGGILSFIIGYLATFGHKPRMMTVTAGFLTLGSFFMFLPHLIVKPYDLGSKLMESCVENANHTECSEDDDSSTLSHYVGLLIFGQILHGFAGVGVYTVGVPLLDESVDMKNSPVFIGIMQGVSSLGPAVGFLFGGFMLHYYVDFDRVDMSQIDVNPDDPRWVGAWWVGFAVAAGAGVSVILLMACFPKELPETAKHQASRVSEAYGGHGEAETQDAEFGRSWKDFFTSLRIVFCNPTWVFMTLGAILEAGIVQAFATFLPKVLQFQFTLSPGKAAMIAGALVVPGAVVGQIIGGFIPKWLNLKVRGLTLQCAIGCATTLVLSFTFIFRCDMQDIAGVTVEYLNSSLPPSGLVHPCNADCGCTSRSYEPVCGADHIQYFSPCHAGCHSIIPNPDGEKIHADCSCIATGLGGSIGSQTVAQPVAVDGICQTDCNAIYIFVPLILLMCLGTFIANTSFQSVTMRVVPLKQRAFAMGLQGTIIRFLGATPFPLLFGAMFDKVCLIWQEKCKEEGSCWIYNNENLGRRLMFLIIIVKSVSTLSFFIAFLVYKPPKNGEDNIMEKTIESTKLSDDDEAVAITTDDLDIKNRKCSSDVGKGYLLPSVDKDTLDKFGRKDNLETDMTYLSNGYLSGSPDNGRISQGQLIMHTSSTEEESAM